MATISVTLPTDGTTADVADYNTPITTIVNEINGNLDNDNIDSAAAISGSKLADNSIDITAKASSFDGWIEVSDSWTYASATTITVPTDATTKYSVGDKIKLVQTTTKYFYITGVTATTLTINGGSDYTLANAAISGVFYSKASTPLGFPGEFAFTPSWTNLTPGSGTNVGYFNMIGRTVYYRTRFVYGSGSSLHASNPPTLTLPVASSSNGMSDQEQIIGNTVILDSGTARVYGTMVWATSTTATCIAAAANTTYVSPSAVHATAPMTWTTSDALNSVGSYVAA